MSWTARTVMILLVVAFPGHRVHASGVSEQAFSDWYGDIAARSAVEDVENTGLTVFPTLSVPAGGEYEGMGTAYTAGARDVSFLEANPAASSDLQFTELALFHNNLIADTSLEGLGYTTRLEDFGFGVGGKFVHVPFTEYDDFGIQQGSARYVEAIVAGNLSYNFFNSFYFNGVSAGANLKTAYRSIPETIAQDQSAAAVMIDVGLLSRFNVLKFYPSRDRNFAVGTVVRNLGPNVLAEPLPTQWTSGIAYSPLRPVLIGADVTVPFTPFSSLPAEQLGYAVGTAVTVTDFFTIRSGFQMKGGNPRITMGGSVGIQDMTVTINYTLDMTTQLTAFDRFSLQAGFSLGDRGRGQQQDQIRTLYLDALQAFADGDLEETIDLTEQVLDVDPRFQPAAETLEMARRMQSLQEQMESIRTGEDAPGDPSLED
ncbi:MAG: UPF0164 family protein [Alkalispirochaeta sp.]